MPAADSWRFRAFSAAATGPLLRPTLLRFYAHATEHTRRLLGIQANAKFASAAAGPDSGDLNVNGCLEGCLLGACLPVLCCCAFCAACLAALLRLLCGPAVPAALPTLHAALHAASYPTRSPPTQDLGPEGGLASVVSHLKERYGLQ